MHEFSGLYKKMCAKAEEIQKDWKDNIQDFDEYTSKGDYEDGFGTEVQAKIDDVDVIIENNIWLPLEHQLKEKLFNKGERKISYKKFLKDMVNKPELKKIEKHFKGEERMNVLALMFWMRNHSGKEWGFDKEDWVKISY